MRNSKSGLAGIILATMLLSLPNLLAEPYVSNCNLACQERVGQKFEAAKQLDRAKQYESAAQMFEAVIAEEPLSIISLDACV